ncbi:MAG: hypothetical protein E7445_02820 [Ruminococcaceae bacterium]|nr:hypothetical protein [Oscillospiraceae bacterium]
MKIGIIGPTFSIKRLHSMLHLEDAFVECVEYSCRLSRVPELLERVQPELDGIIFTGNRYLDFAGKHSAAIVPWMQIRRTDAAVYRALLQARLAGHDIHRITYDLSNSAEAMQLILCRELGLEPDRIALFRYNDTPSHEEYLRNPELAGHYADGACAYHNENFGTGRASICLTDSPGVEDAMKQNGYPAFLVSFTEEDVLAALNDMRTRIQMYGQRRAAEHREAVLALTVRMKEEYGQGDREYRQIRSISKIESALFRFVQEISGALERRSGGQYMFFASRESLEMKTGGLLEMDFAKTALSEPDVEQVALGIGYGLTHMEARSNALQANQSARQQTYSCWYVKDGGEVARGPFILRPPQTATEYSRQLLERVSRDTGVGLTVLDALAKAQRQYGFQEITPGELAKMANMSLNNIHRILVRLEAGGYAAVVGRQSHADTGRPRRLFRLNLGFVPPDDAK